jgi:glucose/arabinose dehydrogenase
MNDAFSKTKREAAQILKKWWAYWMKSVVAVMLLLPNEMAGLSVAKSADIPFEHIQLPPGFKIDVFATDIPDARSMAMSPDGIIFVGTRKAGKVYAVIDRNGDYRVDEVLTIAKNLKMPNGVAFSNGSLYVAEINRILRYDKIEERIHSPPKPVVITDIFPNDRHHGWKYIAIGPDGMLYVPVGAPCNICEKDDPRYATIMRMQIDGSELEIYAHGVRNTVGFDWHPRTKELWFTNNGRDWMGDDLPPDTLHQAPQKGLHFGFPYCHAGSIPDPQFGRKRSCDAFAQPAMKLSAHVAPLGMKFYTGNMFPSRYRNQIFIAEHGSWNRSVPIGYRITMAVFDKSNTARYEIFADGWLKKDNAWGRPVDIIVINDGSMLVSDDRAGVIYRISHGR